MSTALRAAMADAAWVQWRALGGQTSASREPAVVVDPEALVLVSLWLRDEEPRFWDLLDGFAGNGSRLLSVQRLKRLTRVFPSDAPDRVAAFAAAIVAGGRDPRWRGLAGMARHAPGRSGKVGDPWASLAQPGALLLRWRAGFGVDIRTDVFVHLLTNGGAWREVRELAEALGYATVSVRVSCDALQAARFIERGSGRPVAYRVTGARWAPALGLTQLPEWRPWSCAWPLVLGLRAWLEAAQSAESERLTGSLAREWVMEHEAGLRALGVSVPAWRDARGPAIIEPFDRMVGDIVNWLGAST